MTHNFRSSAGTRIHQQHPSATSPPPHPTSTHTGARARWHACTYAHAGGCAQTHARTRVDARYTNVRVRVRVLTHTHLDAHNYTKTTEFTREYM
eukprot:1877017-Pleurochrysis_carterae.AAC.1